MDTGKTSFIWRTDGTRHGGPRDDFGCQRASDVPNGVSWSKDVLRIGTWTIGKVDLNHMSVGTAVTADIFRSDGTIHPGPRLDWQASHQNIESYMPANLDVCPKQLKAVNKKSAPACDFFLKGGDGWVEVGTWRFGNVDNHHFSFSHKEGKTSVLYRWDGNYWNGQDISYGLWHRKGQDRATNILFGDRFLEFAGQWRLAQIDNNHFSLSHVKGPTAMIWRIDGTKHPGPRGDFNGFAIRRNYGFNGISKG